MSSNPDFLVLDRSLPSRNFLTWRLSRDAGPSLQRKADIPSKVCAEKKNAYDYLHTRVSVLHNNLTQCGDALYTFTELDADTVSLHKIALGSESFTLVAEFESHQEEQAQEIEQTPSLHCSVAEVVLPGESSRDGKEGLLLLTSTGSGDLTLIDEYSHGTQGTTAEAVSGDAPKIVGAQPFVIEVAYRNSAGVIRCIVWTIQGKSAQHAASCDIYAIALRHDESSGRLAVLDEQLLKHSKIPPHAVLVSAEEDAVALAIDPLPEAGSNVESVAAGAEAMDLDDDGDAPSPRTLRAAAERLAQYTSEEPAPGAAPSAGAFKDLYSEVGPDDEGTTFEPECSVFTFKASSIEFQTPSKDTAVMTDTAGPSGSTVPTVSSLRMHGEVSCSPYKVLTSQKATRGRNSALVGFIDDVDCAVASLTLSPTTAAGASLTHIYSIPAFAYVATGKVQRKFVLLGVPGHPIAAVIVEANRFAFVYHAVSSTEAYGVHQVLDLELSNDANVLGASLHTVDDKKAKLYVLTQASLYIYDLM